MTDFLSLQGKRILLTGASSGIGYATAIQLHKQGAHLLLTGRNESKLQELLSEIGTTNHCYFLCDISDQIELDRLVEQVNSIDGIVHSAGILMPLPIKFITEEKMDAVFNVNYRGPVFLTSKLLRKKKINQGASIIFLSSISSKHPYRGGSLYVSTKAALEAFSRTLALELAPQKIRSNCISPTMVRTPIFDQTEAAVSKEEMDRHEKKHLLGFAETIDIANMIMFLLSDAAKYMTGANIVMDGGATISSN